MMNREGLLSSLKGLSKNVYSKSSMHGCRIEC